MYGLIVLSSITFTGCATSESKLENAKATVLTTYRTDGVDKAIAKIDEIYPDSDTKNLDKKLELLMALSGEIATPTKGYNTQSTSKSQTINYCSEMKISDIKWNNSGSGAYLTLEANVKNTGDRTVKYYEVIIKLYDKDGNVLDSVWTNNSGDFAPNESSKIDKMIKKDDRISSCRMFVDKVSFK